jgi:hypothetical protein
MTTYTSKDASHIARFDGTDFSNWKFEISLVLEQHRLLNIVNGTELLPAPVIPDATTGVVTNQAAINSWTERDVSARSCIYSSVEHSTRKALVTCTTSASMWAKLHTQYQQNAAEAMHIMIQKYYRYEYEEGNSVMSHITTIESMARQLADYGSPVDD